MIAVFCHAQKNVAYNHNQWIQYFNQLKLSEKLTIYSDVSLRRINSLSDRSQITIRTGLGYPIIQNLQGISGVASFITYNNCKLSRIEFRPYQEFNTTQLFGKVTVQHRFRLESRFFRSVSDGNFTSESNFNFRFRYRLYGTIPVLKLSATKPYRMFLLNVGDELFINAGKEIAYNVFDNNRLVFGLTLRYTNNLSFNCNYINQTGQRNLPDTFEHSDIVTFGIVHKLSLCKTTDQSE